MLGYLSSFDDDLFDQFDRMRRQMDHLFGAGGESSGIRSAAGGTYPAINVGASSDYVSVYVFAADIDIKSLDVSLQQNMLTVSGERKLEFPEAAQAYRAERFNGSFRRVLTLPEDVDADKVDANYREGVLHIKVQRREQVSPRKIEVK